MIGHLTEALWPSSWRPLASYLEIRAIRDGKVRQMFYLADVPDEAASDILKAEGAGADVYFGVLPRIRPSGTNADVPGTTPFLWADVDAKKAHEDLATGKQMALFAINSFSTPPHIIVDSGGGYHCYWLLDEPAPLLLAQEVMRWIARELKGDFVQDGARILRVPSTTNWKRTPTVARYIRFDLTRPRVRIGDLWAQMPVEPDRFSIRYHGERVDELPEWLQDLIVLGAPKGQRSEASFKVVLYLLRYGRSYSEIEEIFRMHPDGIGAKYAEMGGYAAARWLGRTIEHAADLP